MIKIQYIRWFIPNHTPRCFVTLSCYGYHTGVRGNGQALQRRWGQTHDWVDGRWWKQQSGLRRVHTVLHGQEVDSSNIGLYGFY